MSMPTIKVNGQEVQPIETIHYKDSVEVSRERHGATYLETAALEALRVQEEIKRQQENIERLKSRIRHEMENSNVDELTIPIDDLHDVKLKLTERTTKKMDKEEMATDLGVAVTAINTKFLLKAVEDRRLSYQRFLQYIFPETTEGVSVRRAKAVGRK